MNPDGKILILDDDKEFSALLSDVFTQANHPVETFQSPKKAIKALRTRQYKLLVTDHRMPDMTGLQAFEEVMEQVSGFPVIVVSGYLDNDLIRRYINSGVRGIFLKPLNIFSLLKKTESVLAEFYGEAGEQAEASAVNEVDKGRSQVDFPFRAYPCWSGRSAEFARRLHSLRRFKANLLLVGEGGIDYSQIGSDLVNLTDDCTDALAVVPEGCTPEEMRATIERAAEKAERVTVMAGDIEKLSPEQVQAVTQLSRKAGVFAGLDVDTRQVFHLGSDLDTLYEEGRVDEALYMFLGTSEVRVPPLRDCPEDLIPLARRYLADAGGPSEAFWEASAGDFLRARNWEGNHAELRSLMRTLAESGAVETIHAGLLEAALNGSSSTDHAGETVSAAEGPPPARSLENMLNEARDDFARAVFLLCDRDVGRAADTLGVSPHLLEEAGCAPAGF